MRKRVVMFLLGVSLAMSIAGCGGEKEKTYTQSEVDAMMEGKNGNQEPDLESEETAEVQTEIGDEITMFVSETELEETVILDEKDVKITVNSISYGYSPEITLQFENNTDKELEFYTGTIGYSWNSVNGYMSSGYMNETISPGKKVNGKIRLDTDELMLKGIRDISELQIGFHIEDENNDEYIVMDPVTIKSKNNYDYSEESFYQSILNPSVADELGCSVIMSSDEVLYDENGIRVNSVAVAANSDGDESLMLEVENTSSEQLVASIGDIAINGIVVSSGTWDSSRINAGKKDVAIVQLDRVLESEYKDILEISEIGEISLNLQVKDKHFDDIADPENITITIPDRENTSGAEGTEIYNANDLKISSLGKMDDPSEYSGDIHFLFLVENTGSENRVLDVDYDGNSINGFMTDLSGYAVEMKPGQKALLDAYIFDHNKSDCDIESADDVTELELAFTIKDNDWSKISEDSATVTY